MRVELVDPPAYSPPYDDALAAALARAGASVRLTTSEFAYGEVPKPVGYTLERRFYRRAFGAPGSRVRQISKGLADVPELLNWRRGLGGRADVAHFQWLSLPRIDLRLLPRRPPTVLTIHDPLIRGGGHRARLGPEAFSRVDEVVVHSEYARTAVIEAHGLEPSKVTVIRHGALGAAGGGPTSGLGHRAEDRPPLIGALPAELSSVAADTPVVLSYGLIRPYKGLGTLLAAWHALREADAELWVVGRAMMDLGPLLTAAPANVRFVSRFVSDAEEVAIFDRADIVALPYERSERFGFSGVLATALGVGKATIVSDVGGFADVGALGAAAMVPAGDVEALRAVLAELIGDRDARERLERAATTAAREHFSWDAAAGATLALYERLGA